MTFPAKDYHRLSSLQKRWGVSQEDIFYALENGLLRACVWLPLLYVERGVIRDRKFIYEIHEHREGFVGVRPEDCRLVCSKGRAKLRIFHSIYEDDHILRLAYEPPQPDICVRLNELIVLKQNREKFEISYGIIEANVDELPSDNSSPHFCTSEDYRYVRLGDIDYHLGDVQSRVIQMLHEAALSQNPWVHAKTLIHKSGSRADRFKDLFKHQSHWRKLVVSNERGYYRLNIPMEHLGEHSPAFDKCTSTKYR